MIESCYFKNFSFWKVYSENTIYATTDTQCDMQFSVICCISKSDRISRKIACRDFERLFMIQKINDFQFAYTRAYTISVCYC